MKRFTRDILERLIEAQIEVPLEMKDIAREKGARAGSLNCYMLV